MFVSSLWRLLDMGTSSEFLSMHRLYVYVCVRWRVRRIKDADRNKQNHLILWSNYRTWEPFLSISPRPISYSTQSVEYPVMKFWLWEIYTWVCALFLFLSEREKCYSIESNKWIFICFNENDIFFWLLCLVGNFYCLM